MSDLVTDARTILVTGASGVLGRRLLPLLRQAGWRTRCLVHDRAVAGSDEVVRGDLADPASLRVALDSVDAVIHLAAATHVRKASVYAAVNVEGTRALLAAAPATVRRFVHVSTRAIASDGGAYSRSKLRAEEAVRDAALPWVIVRPGEVFGGRAGGAGVDDIVDRARRGRPILVVAGGEQEVCPVHIDDVLPVLVRAVSSPEAVGQTFSLFGECMSVREFATRASAAFESSSRIVSVPRNVVAALSALSRYVPLPLYPDQLASLEAAKAPAVGDAGKDLGFAPRRLELALLDVPR
ncbi:MAG: NAD-dependent epimerase/dehydratase family protein [Gaiellaceae bacterium]